MHTSLSRLMGADCLRAGRGHLSAKADVSRYCEAGARDLGLLRATDAPLQPGVTSVHSAGRRGRVPFPLPPAPPLI